MHLDCTLASTTSISRDSSSTSKNPPSTNSDEKFTNYSTSTSCSISVLTFIIFFSTYSSSLKSLIIMIASVASEKCFQRPRNVFSNPSPTMAAPHKTSFCVFFFSRVLIILKMQEVTSMQVVQCKLPWLLKKTSFLILYTKYSF